MIPADLNFGAAWWLWGLAAVPVLTALFVWAERQAARRLAALLPAPRLRAQLTGAASVGRRRWRYGFLLLGLAGLVLTLAQPRWGYQTWESHRRGLDVIAVVDVSKSMLATDFAPSRLVRAKLALHDLALQLPGDRLGLVAFAGSAFLQAPLTIDYDAVLRAVNELDTNLIPMGGTNLGAGINLALEAFGKAEAGNRAILLLSDGEPTSDSDQANGVQAAARAAEAGVKVFALGFGTPEGSLIPLDGTHTGEFVRDENGQTVRTRLNESGLKEIAQAGGGFYARAENGDAALRRIIRDGLDRLKAAEIDARFSHRPIERYQWPLGCALAALSIGQMLGERRKAGAGAAAAGGATAGSGGRLASASSASGWALLGFCAGLAGAAPFTAALAEEATDPTPASAFDLYQNGRYNEAYDAFEDLAKQHPKVGDLQFNAGASAYMAKQYEAALDAFSKALTSPEPSLQAKSQYNFANALFRRGEQQKERQEKISDWRNAIQHYETALHALKAASPPPADALLASNTVYNRDLVQHRLAEELKQPPPQQQQQDKQNQPKSQDPRQPPQGGQQNKQDQQQSSSQGAPQKSNPNQQGQSGQPKSPADSRPGSPPPAGQPGQRPDPSSVPNQDKARQRGDLDAPPGKHGGDSPKEQNPPPSEAEAGEKGKMTPDQARTLLQSLKDEDTTVNLNDDADRRRDEPVLKDW